MHSTWYQMSLFKMKPKEVEKKSIDTKTKQAVAQPLERFRVLKTTTTESITKQEISRFWIQKRFDEEEHLLAAIKDAARIRFRDLPEEDYKQFEDSLSGEDYDSTLEKHVATNDNSKEEKNNKEVLVSTKGWWMKSNSAYLNQPDIESPMERASMTSCFAYKPISAISYIYQTRTTVIDFN